MRGLNVYQAYMCSGELHPSVDETKRLCQTAGTLNSGPDQCGARHRNILLRGNVIVNIDRNTLQVYKYDCRVLFERLAGTSLTGVNGVNVFHASQHLVHLKTPHQREINWYRIIGSGATGRFDDPSRSTSRLCPTTSHTRAMQASTIEFTDTNLAILSSGSYCGPDGRCLGDHGGVRVIG